MVVYREIPVIGATFFALEADELLVAWLVPSLIGSVWLLGDPRETFLEVFAGGAK